MATETELKLRLPPRGGRIARHPLLAGKRPRSLAVYNLSFDTLALELSHTAWRSG